MILLIKLYQKYLSPFLGDNCRFYPSCSQYMIESISNLGKIRGFWYGLMRIFRCHPFNQGGIDLPLKSIIQK